MTLPPSGHTVNTQRPYAASLWPDKPHANITDTMSRLGDQLRAVRDAGEGAEWTIKAIAQRADMHERAIKRAEDGIQPDPWRIASLARGYAVSLTDAIAWYLEDLPDAERQGLSEFVLSFPVGGVADDAWAMPRDPDGMSLGDQIEATGRAFAQRVAASLEPEPETPDRPRKKREAGQRG